ncbi:hypothetical protein ACRXCV_00050 (plasmid) [Halobacteriovorax sp. GFR7]|uniref:hypothetical protein n=1 Tax=unclassified Halobacteriovorax TaxID=2639665 RepID=UPI003D965FBB
MGVKVNKDNGVGVSLSDVLEQMRKKDKDSQNVRSADDLFVEIARIPSGIFPFDYATGGGFPRGKISTVYGMESSGKSVITYCAIGQAQLLEPDSYQIVVDVEQAWDSNWAKHFIPDLSRVIVVTEDTAEKYIDRAEALLMAREVNLMVVDSVAMLSPENEVQSSAEKVQVGGNANLVTKMLRKFTARLALCKLEGHMPAVICINQIRFKIGFVMGNPETMPAGKAVQFMSSLIVRFNGSNEKDSSSSIIEEWKKTTFILKKWKMPVLQRELHYFMRMRPEIDTSTGEVIRDIGFVDDVKPVMSTLKTLNLLRKSEDGKQWVLDQGSNPNAESKLEFFKTQDLLKEKMYDPDNALWFSHLKTYLINVSKALYGVG